MGYRMVSSLEAPHLSIARKDSWGTGQHSTERVAIAPSGALAWSTFLSLARRFSVRLGASSKRRGKGVTRTLSKSSNGQVQRLPTGEFCFSQGTSL